MSTDPLSAQSGTLELDGPSRTIIVEPIETPTPAPPERVPTAPTPTREPEKVPA